MVNSAQMIVTRWGETEAVSLSSPQLPGIVAAFDEDPTAEEVIKVAIAAGLDPDGDVEVHIEVAIRMEDATYFVRSRQDYRASQRVEVCESIASHIPTEKGLRDYMDVDRFGDAVVVCALPSDTIGKSLATVLPDQPVTLASVDPTDDRITCIGVVLGSGPEDEGNRLADFGLDLGSTVGELLEARANSRVLVHV